MDQAHAAAPTIAFRHVFADAVRQRGRAYYERGAVRLVAGQAGAFTAIVRGSRDYTVQIQMAGADLRVACDCPYFTGAEGAPCKHVWAALLAVEGGAHRPGGLASPPRAVPGPAAPPWRRRLEALARDGGGRAAPVPAPGRQIVYVVDLPASLDAHALLLDVGHRQRRRDGGWTRPRPLRMHPRQLADVSEASDREALALLFQAQPEAGDVPYAPPPQCFRLPGPLARIVLPSICATGRALLRGGDDALAPLQWDGAGPWQFWLKLRDRRGSSVVEGELRRGEQRRELGQAELLIRDGVVLLEGRFAELEDAGAFDWIVDLRRSGALEVPRAHEAALLAALAGRRARPRLDLEEHAVEEAPGAPVPCLEVAAVPEGWNDRLGCKVVFDYAGVPVPEHEAGWCVLESARRLLVRDLAAERAASARLGELGFRRLGAGPDEPLRLEISPRNLPAAVRALLAEGWHVAAEGRRYRPAAAARVRVVSGIDWFDLEGGVEFAGQEVPLAQVLAALRRGDDAVRLGDGSYGMLPEDWLRRLGPLVDLGAAQGGGLRFRRSQAALLDALLASQPGVEVDAAFDQARRALAEFEGVRPQDPPAGFAGALRAYQREGLGWLRFLERFGFGGCLADDMGLGKTVQVLALLASRQAQGRPGSLVVVPRSVVFNWKEEAARFTPALRVLDHTGPDRARSPEGFAGWDVVLATYGTLRRDALLFQQARFDYVVLDEAQAIKNAATDAAKAARLLRGDHRLALSGTPVENHVGELWSLFEFLNPGMLGRSAAFRKGATELDDERRAALARALRPFVLRRTKEQVARDLPPKVEQTIHCELDAEQRRLYEGLRQHYRASLLPRFAAGGGGRLQVLEALLRLRQAACHPELVEGRPGPRLGAKLEALLPRLEELREEGHKALVFSQFTSFLAILRRELDARGLPHAYLDGRTRDRREQVKRFQEDPACGLFLISLKAGGLGLNLTAAEYVFLLDPWWNPAAEAQAVDRAHRLGQQRHVFAYRLIASATVEEKVLELQQRKRALADALLGADKSLVAGLEREDLELLLS